MIKKIKPILLYTSIFILGFILSKLITTSPEVSQETSKVESTATNLFTSDSDNLDDEISSLRLLIQDYEEKINSLITENSGLSEKLLADEKLLALASKTDINRQIDMMSDTSIRKKINLVIDDDQLENISDTNKFAKRMAEVALEGSDENSGETDRTNVDVRINISHELGYQEMPTNQIVARKYKRLYANILTSPLLDYILVRWKNLSTNETLVYKGIGLNQNFDYQYVWAKAKDGWEVGDYQINIYKISDNLELLASKQYQIIESIDDGPEVFSDEPVEGVSILKKAH